MRWWEYVCHGLYNIRGDVYVYYADGGSGTVIDCNEVGDNNVDLKVGNKAFYRTRAFYNNE